MDLVVPQPRFSGGADDIVQDLSRGVGSRLLRNVAAVNVFEAFDCLGRHIPVLHALAAYFGPRLGLLEARLS